MTIFPPIPAKRYFTIGEVARLCNVKAHVLRYWEQEFQQLRPSKRRGNRRYYRLHDVEMVRQIYHLLYDQGYTIHGARQYLADQKAKPEAVASVPLAPSALTTPTAQIANAPVIRETIAELEALLVELSPAD